MRWFVTGAARIVGRAIVRAASARGDEVVAAVASEAEGARFAGLPGVTALVVDWDGDEAALVEGMKGCAVVAHTDVGDPWSTDRAECERAVLVRTEQVIDAARAAKVSRVILRSSERVTSSGDERRMADESLAHSDSWLSPWDEMLSVSEGIVCALTAGIEGIALRPAFVWGDEDDESLPRFRALAEKKALVLPGGGDQSFCSTHADNLAFAFLCAADAPTELAGNAYWVTDDERITAKRFLTRWLVSAGARGPRSGLLPFRAARALAWIDERSGGMSRAELALVGVALSVDSKRVRNELGYEPKVTVDEGMKRLAASAHRAGESQRSERSSDAAAG